MSNQPIDCAAKVDVMNPGNTLPSASHASSETKFDKPAQHRKHAVLSMPKYHRRSEQNLPCFGCGRLIAGVLPCLGNGHREFILCLGCRPDLACRLIHGSI